MTHPKSKYELSKSCLTQTQTQIKHQTCTCTLDQPKPFLTVPGEPTVPWLRWKRSFDLYMTASGYCDFTEARQKAILLHCLGQEGQRFLFATISDETYTTISKENVEKELKELFGKINVAGERSTFRASHQKHSEPVESYVASLRELASTCEFGAFEEEAIRDQLQEHAASDHVREKLVSKTYSLKDAILIAKEIESGARNSLRNENRSDSTSQTLLK